MLGIDIKMCCEKSALFQRSSLRYLILKHADIILTVGLESMAVIYLHWLFKKSLLGFQEREPEQKDTHAALETLVLT